MESKTITFTGPQMAELLVEQVEQAPLGPEEVYGATVASLVSAGTELNWSYQGDGFPSVPGYASVFRVEKVGFLVRDLQPGDLAFTMGPHRSWQRASRQDVIPVPAGLDAAEAAFARLMCVTMSTLTTTTARPPQQVLVTGLGPVGHLASRIFSSCGYRVLACDPVESRREFAAAFGIRTCPEVPTADPSVVGQVALALECSGREDATLACLDVVRKRGEVVLVGVPWRKVTDIDAHTILHRIFHRYAVVRSGWEWEVPNWETDFRANSIFGQIAGAMEWLSQGRITVDGLYRRVRPADAHEVYQALLHARFEALAAVFDWSME